MIRLDSLIYSMKTINYTNKKTNNTVYQKLTLISFCFILKHQKNRFIRYIICLPINCQRTHSNAKTARKKKSEHVAVLLKRLNTKAVHVGAFLSQKKKQPSLKKMLPRKQQARTAKTIVRTLKKSVWR